ncbi:Retrovirus-related Pol polyprotein from type-1 retrotransposable element R1 [Eumeta japonica]|uniref:Retrovirus-related Pol polyprotein from type-1 retrotransposable element R1 n=1 Tax=Eumeta variegata TaxID=151549 RepID=A0A4C1U400_EUMVA|nr:Retrovirus-related Pol polyprotein from type-1 retrotransposable element R1 [Eumeta japonica]
MEGLHVLNEGNIPTFEVYRGDRLFQSAVDVTACSSALLDRAEKWQVVRGVTSSDHNAVTFEIRTGGRPGPGPFRGAGLTAEMVESVDSCDQLDGVVELYTECVRCACDAAIPPKRSTRKVKLPWWSPELEGLKKDANTKKRRIRNAAPSRRPHVVEEYVRAKEVYERAAADARTASWKRFCSTQDRESMWDGVYRVIRDTGGSREDVLLRDDSGRVCNPDESAALLAETFFPGDQVDTDGPHHAEIRRRTDGIGCPPEALDVLSGVDPPFTGAELKIALRAFNPKKAPGIDGFTSDICQAAILRDPGLFLAVANKCLRLGYFPRAWKVAAIKVIPKPGKDDYSRPKSYRPIGLLSVMGKNRGKDARLPHQMAYHAEAAGETVWFHAAARDGGLPV